MTLSRATTDSSPLTVSAALAVALAASLWALLGTGDCFSCNEAARAVGTLPLAALGVGLYSLLLLASLFARERAWRRVVLVGALLAAGAHLTLVSTLLTNHLSCPPCLLTAAGAFAAAMCALWPFRPRVLAFAFTVIPMAALITYGAVLTAHRVALEHELREARKAAALVRASEPPVAPGHARIVFFTRPNCHYCRELKEQTLPSLRRTFGASLEAKERPAWPTLPTPTIVILGQKGAVFGGLPPEEDLRQAIEHARGTPGARVPATGLAL